MRFPFISRRRAEDALCVLVEATRRTLNVADIALCEERAARREVEAELATQQRVITRLTNQLLDATGHQGEPLLPAARTVLGLDKEDAE